MTFLRVNMVAEEGEEDHCGVFGHAAQFPEGKSNVSETSCVRVGNGKIC